MTKKQGRQCHICIGCGRCELPAEDSLRILAESSLKFVQKEVSAPFVLADIGTTTIAMELYDTSGQKRAEYVCANPQRVFGADVISRIQAAENSINAMQMQTMIREVLKEGIKRFAAWEQEIRKIYIVGNTTMLYLLRGHDTAPLGQAPFNAEFLNKEPFFIGETEAVTLPGLSAFIGADVLAGILACGMQKRKELSLLIDLGTNGELVLGNSEKMIACSTAAGPVFDGLCNKEGTMVWGADAIHLVATLLEEGFVDKTGLLAEAYFEQGITVGGVCITQEIIRDLQTAKAAIATGVECLLQEYGISSAQQIEKVYLAGGLGYYLNERDVIRIGLLPPQFCGKIQVVGNTALAGAYLYGTQEEEAKIEKKVQYIQDTEGIIKKTQVINLAQWQDFGERFINKLDF